MTTSQLLAAAASKPSGTSLSDLIPLLLLMGVVFFFFSSSRRRQGAMAQRQAALAARSFVEGDEVVTQSGIIGRITAIEGDRVWLELDAGVIVEFMLAAVQRKIEPVAPPASDREERDVADGWRARGADESLTDPSEAGTAGAGADTESAGADGAGADSGTGTPTGSPVATATDNPTTAQPSGSDEGGLRQGDHGGERDETFREADSDATLQADRDATGWTEPAGGELRDSEAEEVGARHNTAGRQERR